MDALVQFATYMVLVSVAAERLVEMTKTSPLFKILEKQFHGTAYQIMAALCGAAFCYANPPSMPLQMNQWATVVVVGLMASGGSAMWHEILAMLNTASKLLVAKKELANVDVKAANVLKQGEAQ